VENREPIIFFGERGFRQDISYQATVADPFLFTHNARLYLFYEVKTDFGVGEIWAKSMNTEGEWENHGPVLKEKFHLSYPQVFSYKEKIWMIPEAASSGKVWLYSSESFPFQWRRSRVLIEEPLVDPSLLIREDGLYLLGTTRDSELKLFHSNELHNSFRDTGITVTKDRTVSRNAGAPLLLRGMGVYRVAQDCKESYGQNISILKINKISSLEYSEEVVLPKLYQKKPKWMALGCHHISMTTFQSEVYVAVDGMRKDSYFNTLSLARLKLMKIFKR